MRAKARQGVAAESTRLAGLLMWVLLPACQSEVSLSGPEGGHGGGATSGGSTTSGASSSSGMGGQSAGSATGGGSGGAVSTGGGGGSAGGCADGCTVGTTQCSSAQIEHCELQANGCTAWGPPSTCLRGGCLVDECTAIPTDSALVAYWNFSEPGPTVVDRSGNGNDGVSWDAVQVAGKIGLGYQTGVSQCLLFPLSLSLMMAGGTAVTMMAWVNMQACQLNDNAVIFNRDFGYEIAVECPSMKLETALYTDQQLWTWNQTSTQLPLDEWRHVSATWDGTIVRVYLDAVEVGSWPASGQFLVTTAGLGIGCYHVPNNGMPDVGIAGFFPGVIDEVAVYERSLSPEEISAYYLATK